MYRLTNSIKKRYSINSIQYKSRCDSIVSVRHNGVFVSGYKKIIFQTYTDFPTQSVSIEHLLATGTMLALESGVHVQ